MFIGNKNLWLLDSNGEIIQTLSHDANLDIRQINKRLLGAPSIGNVDSDSDKELVIGGVNKIVVFDVSPVRQTMYSSMGCAIAPYYAIDISLDFFKHIISVFKHTNINIFWKQKRFHAPHRIHPGFYVKRDDLMGDNNELPPWGKLGGIKKLLEADIIDKTKGILQLSVRGSYSGWGVAALAPQLGYQVNIAYPNSKNFPQDVVDKWRKYDVNLVPLKPNMSSVVLGMAKKYASGNNLETLPYGFQHEVYFDYWERRVQ